MTTIQSTAYHLVALALEVRDNVLIALQTRKEAMARALKEALRYINQIEDLAIRKAARTQWFRAFNSIAKVK